MNYNWANDAVFYHIYPLGLCGAPRRNDFGAAPVARLEQLYPWLDHIQSLGCTALYLGPLFESTAHGYDTADYFQVDRRLGTRETLAAFSREVHRRGLRLVLDGVFNHVGRDFWAFRDVQANRQNSPFCGWFEGIDFGRSSPRGDPFSYEGWAGHYDLVKFNLAHPEVRSHLFEAIRCWVQDYEIDGLRLDAADVIAPDFLTALAQHCRELRGDFWLMGEMVHGDYRRLANPQTLAATTNYEVYKSLYSSHADRNYFELAYAAKRQSGMGGIYRDLTLYTFADNHDVDRVASSLKNPAHLYPLYCLLFTLPGIPSIYYGSEWGIAGRRTAHSDAELRPALSLNGATPHPQPDLEGVITRLARLRAQTPALRQGDYTELHVAAEQFAFARRYHDETVVVAANAAANPAVLDLRLPIRFGQLVDHLNPGNSFPIKEGRAQVEITATWARVMEIKE
jgi:glycosidase